MPSRLSPGHVCLGFTVLFTILAFLGLTRSPQGLEALHSPSALWSSAAPETAPSWFLGIFVGPGAFSRRQIIRSTWVSRYAHPSHEYRFMIGDYSNSSCASAIDAENATYGDIWVIDNFKDENYETANTVKNMEFFTYMAQQHQYGRVRRYDFVSKVDDDQWFNLPIYRDSFISPRLPGGDLYQPNTLTLIGRPFCWSHAFVFPAGRLYTVSWPLVEYYAQKYAAHSERKADDKFVEDQLMGFYLHEDKVDLEFVVMEYEQAYDLGVEFVVTNVTDSMLVHDLKSDQQILEVGTLFDEKGKWNGRELEGVTSFNRTGPGMIRRFGKPSDKELKELQVEWAKGPSKNPLDSLDWKLIHNKIQIEDRRKLGSVYPLTLRNNNASTGCVPIYLNPRT